MLVSVVLWIFKVHPGVVVADISDVAYRTCSYTLCVGVDCLSGCVNG